MSKDVLYQNESIDLSVSKRFLAYTGQIISIEDIQKVKCKQNKADSSIGQSLFLLGFLLLILGKFREGFVAADLFYLDTYSQIVNGWDMLGIFFLFISLMTFLLVRGQDTIIIYLKNGKAVNFHFSKRKEVHLNDVDKAIKQAVQHAKLNSA